MGKLKWIAGVVILAAAFTAADYGPAHAQTSTDIGRERLAIEREKLEMKRQRMHWERQREARRLRCPQSTYDCYAAASRECERLGGRWNLYAGTGYTQCEIPTREEQAEREACERAGNKWYAGNYIQYCIPR
jgi:hypothetical protein